MKKEVAARIEQQTQEKVLERRHCRRSGLEFPIFQRDAELLDNMKVEIGSKLYEIPLPSESFHWRQFNRMLFRNERNLYKRTCTET
jgi:hypothetical protein